MPISMRARGGTRLDMARLKHPPVRAGTRGWLGPAAFDGKGQDEE